MKCADRDKGVQASPASHSASQPDRQDVPGPVTKGTADGQSVQLVSE